MPVTIVVFFHQIVMWCGDEHNLVVGTTLHLEFGIRTPGIRAIPFACVGMMICGLSKEVASPNFQSLRELPRRLLVLLIHFAHVYFLP